MLSFMHCYGLEYDYYTNYVVNPQKILTNGENPNEMMTDMKLRNMIAQNQVISFLLKRRLNALKIAFSATTKNYYSRSYLNTK
mgnify:CR=1 FL=1